MNTTNSAPERPYLVIPKLIEQPTWGGDYIAITKGWQQRESLKNKKIGQSYELFSGSNLSLLRSSLDPLFVGELTDRDAVQIASTTPDSIPLAHLVDTAPEATLGEKIAKRTGKKMELLIKFTQALGNSFQVHVKDSEPHSFWKPKPEAWYYFEPGMMTLGVKPDTDWNAYEKTLTDLHEEITALSRQVSNGNLSYEAAQVEVKQLLKHYNPWQYVNQLEVPKDQLVDLSRGGTHHSWEEPPVGSDSRGNILLELQLEAMDDVSTIRSFDKGNMNMSGAIRQLHIPDYFAITDRSPEANDPNFYMRKAAPLKKTPAYSLDQLMLSKYYGLNKLCLTQEKSTYSEDIDQFKHIFVQSGQVTVSSGGATVTVSHGHSCFIPAQARHYTIHNSSAAYSEILVSY